MSFPSDNYPPGMSRLDLQHVGEIDWDDEEENEQEPDDPPVDTDGWWPEP